jgi:hypothetical protein
MPPQKAKERHFRSRCGHTKAITNMIIYAETRQPVPNTFPGDYLGKDAAVVVARQSNRVIEVLDESANKDGSTYGDSASQADGFCD